MAVLRGLLDEANHGLVALDERGAIFEANATAAGILGHQRARLIRKPLAALVRLEDRRALRNALATVTPEGAQLEVQFHGSPEPWTISLRALRYVMPRVVVAAFFRSGEAPKPLPAAPTPDQRMERFALRFPQAVVALRRDGKVAFANGQARALLGRQAVRTGVPFGQGLVPELRVLARRLTEVPAPLKATLVDLPDGRVLRVTGLASTAREPAVLFAEDATEEQRHERTMREFLRNAAHQLRTPLAGITAAIETLQAGAKEHPDDRDRFLAHVQTHAYRLNRITRGLLVLARAQAGEQPRVDFVELRPLLEDVVASAEPRPGVKVRLVCAPDIAALAAPELLQEAVAAIVDNAAQHTGEGEVRIAATNDNGRVTLAITDMGGGILPKYRERVFEPFFRVGDDGAGFGLGLAIAAQALAAMGGEIGVVDAPGGGATFTMSLRSATVVR